MLKLLHDIPIFHKSSPHSLLDQELPRKKKQVQKMERKLPSYLQQSQYQLLKKFEEIKLLEGERIHEATIHQDKSRWSLQHGVEGFDLKRNRYQNVIPYDRTRVALQVKPGFSDYINASKIHLDLTKKWGKPCESSNYISCQGPTFNTTSHFWQMVAQSTTAKNVVICMVTPLEEHGISKCFKYWLDVKNDFVVFKSGKDGFLNDLRLKCIDASEDVDIPGVHYTTLSLEMLKPGTTDQVVDERVIHHLYYDQWTDFSKPDNWEAIHQLSKLARGLNDEANPLIVHCSAGVGRSGTFVALDYLFNCVSCYDPSDSQADDLVEVLVQALRARRMMMVQSPEQFVFVYESLAKFLLSG